MDEDNYNEEPTNGTYATVDFHVIYTGDDEGQPWFDLTTHINGTDNVQYSDTACYASYEGSHSDVTLNPDGETDVSFCMDLPEGVGDGATLTVEELLSFDGSSAEWALD